MATDNPPLRDDEAPFGEKIQLAMIYEFPVEDRSFPWFSNARFAYHQGKSQWCTGIPALCGAHGSLGAKGCEVSVNDSVLVDGGRRWLILILLVIYIYTYLFLYLDYDDDDEDDDDDAADADVDADGDVDVDVDDDIYI